jgi:hypothetical protein
MELLQVQPWVTTVGGYSTETVSDLVLLTDNRRGVVTYVGDSSKQLLHALVLSSHMILGTPLTSQNYGRAKL